MATSLVDRKSTAKISTAGIRKAHTILCTVSADDAHGPLMFLTNNKLFTGTVLDTCTDNRVPQSILHRVPNIRRNEILRKNIYFLARQTVKVKNLVIQLTQRGFLNLDHKEKIFSYSPEELFMACEMYAVLITLENLDFDKVLDVFKESENAHLSDLLVSRVANILITQSAPLTELSSITTAPWSCPHCTFLNAAGSLTICSLCSKTRNCTSNDGVAVELPTSLTLPIEDFEFGDFDLDNSKTCEFCTLINARSLQFCTACNNRLD